MEGRDPSSRPSIRGKQQRFMKTGIVFDKGRSGRPRTTKENIDRVRQTFLHFLTKYIFTAVRQLQLPR